jgi:predicted bacteriocin transport accessory protein
MKKRFFIIGIIIIAVIGALLIYKFTYVEDNNKEVNNISNEYTLLDKDNVFVSKSVDEIIKTLKSGTGIIFLGFPECPWCQKYAFYLNEIAKENNIKEIYYYNIKDIRNNNTKDYLKIVSLLSDYLPTDDSGNKRIYVPNLTIVKNGVIVANDNETSLISDGTLPDDYWTEENIDNFKIRINNYLKEYPKACSSCN